MPTPPEHRRWYVEPIFAGRTLAVLGAGPSLTASDVQVVRRAGWPIIAVNNALWLAPDAAVHFFSDVRWFRWHGASDAYRQFRGTKATIENWHDCHDEPALQRLINHAREGACFTPGRICNGASSGYAAINLAAQLGARRIVLLGFDMQPAADGRTHFHDDHPVPTGEHVYPLMRSYFPGLRAALSARGITVINCTPGSALTEFPMRALSEIADASRGMADDQAGA